jgi:hypothetical protein
MGEGDGKKGHYVMTPAACRISDSIIR